MKSEISRRDLLLLTGAGVGAIVGGSFLTKSAGAVSAPDAQMKAVLDQLAAFKAPPLEKQSPMNARNNPTIAAAVMGVLAQRGRPAVEMVGDVSHQLIPGPGGDLLARIYKPRGNGPFPVLVYFHGGGWVIATLDTYDSSCRALTNAANCIVVSVAYRQAPEYKFPAAAEDAYSATQWVINNAAQIGGDPRRGVRPLLDLGVQA